MQTAAAPAIDDIPQRLERVFTRVFGAQLAFRVDLQRADTERWTSLKHVELLVAIEREFGIRFDGADAMEMAGIPAIVAVMRQRIR
jgi:acyl carrier protein